MTDRLARLIARWSEAIRSGPSLRDARTFAFACGILIGTIAGFIGASTLMTGSPAGVLQTGTALSPDTETGKSSSSTVSLPSQMSLEYTWQDIGPSLIESGAVNLTRLQMLHSQRGNELTDEQFAFFTDGSDDPITLTRANSGFMLNTLWAFGITNKNPLLSDGRMGQLIESGQAGRLASTGGWPLGTRPGGELLNSATIIELTPAQQQRVNNVVKNTYRPCCNNPTSFPDCNHGAAALGLAQLLAAQGASTTEIADALKAANAMWFPQQYHELAIYFKEVKGQDWADVDAQTVLSKEYSSSSGWRDVHQELQQKNLLPDTDGGGASCGV